MCPSASCLLAPSGRKDAVLLRLLEGEEAKNFLDVMENLSDFYKVGVRTFAQLDLLPLPGPDIQILYLTPATDQIRL